MEQAQLDAALKSVENAIDSRIKKYEEQSSNSVKGVEETVKSELNNLTAKHNEILSQIEKLGKQQDAIELAQKRTNENLDRSKSFIDVLGDSFEGQKSTIKGIQERLERKARFEIGNGQEFMRNKTVGTITLGNVTGALPTAISPNFVMPNERKTHIRSLMMNSRMTDATYSYPVFTDKEGAVAIQTEGSAKAKLDYNVEYKVVNPIVLAATATMSTQILSDIPRLQTYVTQRMVESLLVKEDAEILSGAGGSNRLNGILTQATAYAPTGSANTSSADRYSYLLNAISQLAQLDYSPNGIVVNPYAYYELLQVKTSTKEYTAPLAGITFLDGTLRIAGLPIYQTTALATNAFVVGHKLSS